MGLANSCVMAALVLAGVLMPFNVHARSVDSAEVSAIGVTPRPAQAIRVSAAAQAMAGRVIAIADHRQLPFAIIDKQAALIAVYGADGTLAGTSAVLLGLDPGDASVPGVGERAQRGHLRHGDRTTPAGRFVSEPGHNRDGEAVVWMDYGAALAIHRLRAGTGQPERARRLASGRTSDKRASAGCVVVPVVFYESVISPLLGAGPGVVYVMPEGRAGG